MSRLLREIYTTTSGNSTGIPFAASCLAWYFKELLGYSSYSEHPDSFLDYIKTGTAGEFNLTGTDKSFRDTVAASFVAGDVGKFVVVKSANDRNSGIYKISAYVSASTVTLDFRSAATEYPTAETGITWWVIDPVHTAATGSLTAPDPTAVTDGMFAVLDDGQNINTQKVLILSKQNPGTYSPNQWRGGIVASSEVSRLNSLSGKTLILTVGATSTTVTFTGGNPLSISSIISQINSSFSGTYTEVCYESDRLGYPVPGGMYLTWRAKLIGKISGQPAELPAAALNDITLTYSGSTAWSELGLPGTSNLTAGNLTQVHRVCDNVPPNETATNIATSIRGSINSWGSWNITAGGATDVITLTNDYAGGHGNRTIVGGWSGSGMAGAVGVSTEGAFFRCVTPHVRGWRIELTIASIFNAPNIRVRVSANGSFDTDGYIVGTIYFGSVASAANWLYAEGDPSGNWANIWFHQATNNRYNGCIVSNLDTFETSRVDKEKVCLMGNVGSGSGDYDNGNFIRNYDTKRIGRGSIWVDDRGEPGQGERYIYFLEPTYSGWANGLSKWTSRERNRRRSGSQVGYFTGDSLAFSVGTVTLTDATATFATSDVGKRICVSNCTNAGNNGLFTITARLSATQIQFANASGVNETSSFSWSMDFQDIIEGSYLISDENNVWGIYEIYARLQGHYSVRGGTISGWSAMKAFSDVTFLDRYHINDGIAVAWPGVTPQH
jgi:hypothetical protein